MWFVIQTVTTFAGKLTKEPAGFNSRSNSPEDSSVDPEMERRELRGGINSDSWISAYLPDNSFSRNRLLFTGSKCQFSFPGLSEPLQKFSGIFGTGAESPLLKEEAVGCNPGTFVAKDNCSAGAPTEKQGQKTVLVENPGSQIYLSFR